MPGYSRNTEREVLLLLEEALSQPSEQRHQWLRRKLSEREKTGQRVQYLLTIAERNEL